MVQPYNFRLHCAVIRLEVRPPPYEVHGAPVAYRSGTVVVDLYGLVISTIPGSTSQPGSKESSGRHAAFYSIHQPLPTARPSKQDSGELLCEARWQAILVAFASVGGKPDGCPCVPAEAIEPGYRHAGYHPIDYWVYCLV